MISQIHDELLLETPEAEKEEALALTKAVMSGALNLRVPLDVDARLAKTWSAAH
jgi:DNA polymerase-1